MEYVPAVEKALKETAMVLYDATAHKELRDDDFYVGLEGAIPQHEVNPRTLFARLLGKTVILEGIVTRCTFP
jgi:DNA replication licensing factor MCM3